MVMLVCCLSILAMPRQVHAQGVTELPGLFIEETGSGENVGNQYNSVMQIVVSFTDKDNNEILLQGGCGFLIGNDNNQLQYMITTNEVVTISDKMKEELIQTYNLDDAGALKEKIEVVVSKDVVIGANVITSSEEMDFAILQLDQPLHDRQVILLNDLAAKDYLEKSAFVLGYPSAVRSNQEAIYYTLSDVQRTEGFLEAEEIINGQKYIKHHIFPNYGNIGGPILDGNGNIVALNQTRNDGKNFYALEIIEIIHVMDSLGIPYRTVSQVQAEEEAALAAIVHKEELNRVIEEAESIDLEDYKEKTTVDFDIILQEAKNVQEKSDATQNEVDIVVEKMKEKISVLVPKTPIRIVLIVVVGCILIGVLIMLVILRVTYNVRMERKKKKKAEFTVTEPAPVFKQNTSVLETSYKDLIKAGNRQVSNSSIYNSKTDEQLEGEQTILLSTSSYTKSIRQPAVTLIKCRNNENILINKLPFVIGKDKSKTDYCVQDNPVVSRIHAIIMCEGENYYIQDYNATNGTYINGKRIDKGSRIIMKNADKVILGNEEFVVKMMQ